MSTLTPTEAKKSSNALCRFWESTIGKKSVMAVTGIILFGFVVGHLLGNLQIYIGAAKLDAYAKFLKDTPELLWGTRALLLVSIVLHITAATQLTLHSNAARPIPYRARVDRHATYASRTMMWSGAIILAFVIYHLLHFTFGTAHGSFEEGRVFHNVVSGFKHPLVSGAYVFSMLLLGMHLQHGLWSLGQTLGLSNPRHSAALKHAAFAVAALIVIGNCSIPLAVLSGIVVEP